MPYSFAKTYFRVLTDLNEIDINDLPDDSIINEITLDVNIIENILNNLKELNLNFKIDYDKIIFSSDNVNICKEYIYRKNIELIDNFFYIFSKKIYSNLNQIEKILNKYKINNIIHSEYCFKNNIKTFSNLIDKLLIDIKSYNNILFNFIQNELYNIIFKYYVLIKNYGYVLLKYFNSNLKEQQFFCYQLYIELRKYKRQIDSNSKEIIFKYDVLNNIMKQKRLDGMHTFFNVSELIDTINILEEYYIYSSKPRRNRIFKLLRI
jgi:hypothetical protein